MTDPPKRAEHQLQVDDVDHAGRMHLFEPMPHARLAAFLGIPLYETALDRVDQWGMDEEMTWTILGAGADQLQAARRRWAL